MQRWYGMMVDIEDVTKWREQEVEWAANELAPFEGWYDPVIYPSTDIMQGWAEVGLDDGDSPDEFSRRLALAIWKANTGFLPRHGMGVLDSNRLLRVLLFSGRGI